MDVNWRALNYYESLRRVRDYVSKHYLESLSLYDLADAAGLEAKYLSRVFHQKIGITLTDYIALVRLRAAIMLMQRDDRPILNIALDAGFGSVRTFERVCEKYLRKAPSTIRSSLKPTTYAADVTEFVPNDLSDFFRDIPRS